jgi:ABC-type multidrug transport system fused ATPase/permease subunit
LSVSSLLGGALARLIQQRQGLIAAGVTLERFDELTSTMVERDDPRDASRDSQPLAESCTGICLQVRGLEYTYELGRPILRGVDFQLRIGETVALVGRSGCGKSTLLEILAGLRPPQHGAALLHGRMICWGDPILLVEQEPVLLAGTLLENVAFGLPDVNEDALDAAAAAAGLETLIRRLPEKWDTRVGGRRSGLSVGETRRVCLARALVRRPRVLLLDETLMAVDWATRHEILVGLHHFDDQLTVMLTTTDASDAAMFARVVVLETGRIVEDGPPEVLIDDPSSHFYKLLSAETTAS